MSISSSSATEENRFMVVMGGPLVASCLTPPAPVYVYQPCQAIAFNANLTSPVDDEVSISVTNNGAPITGMTGIHISSGETTSSADLTPFNDFIGSFTDGIPDGINVLELSIRTLSDDFSPFLTVTIEMLPVYAPVRGIGNDITKSFQLTNIDITVEPTSGSLTGYYPRYNPHYDTFSGKFNALTGNPGVINSGNFPIGTGSGVGVIQALSSLYEFDADSGAEFTEVGEYAGGVVCDEHGDGWAVIEVFSGSTYNMDVYLYELSAGILSGSGSYIDTMTFGSPIYTPLFFTTIGGGYQVEYDAGVFNFPSAVQPYVGFIKNSGALLDVFSTIVYEGRQNISLFGQMSAFLGSGSLPWDAAYNVTSPFMGDIQEIFQVADNATLTIEGNTHSTPIITTGSASFVRAQTGTQGRSGDRISITTTDNLTGDYYAVVGTRKPLIIT